MTESEQQVQAHCGGRGSGEHACGAEEKEGLVVLTPGQASLQLGRHRDTTSRSTQTPLPAVLIKWGAVARVLCGRLAQRITTQQSLNHHLAPLQWNSSLTVLLPQERCLSIRGESRGLGLSSSFHCPSPPPLVSLPPSDPAQV